LRFSFSFNHSLQSSKVLFFRLEEEGNTTLLLHLPNLFAETADFGSAVGLGCWLVVATVQATRLVKASSTSPPKNQHMWASVALP
jgi:hypothetical protein